MSQELGSRVRVRLKPGCREMVARSYGADDRSHYVGSEAHAANSGTPCSSRHPRWTFEPAVTPPKASFGRSESPPPPSGGRRSPAARSRRRRVRAAVRRLRVCLAGRQPQLAQERRARKATAAVARTANTTKTRFRRAERAAASSASSMKKPPPGTVWILPLLQRRVRRHRERARRSSSGTAVSGLSAPLERRRLSRRLSVAPIRAVRIAPMAPARSAVKSMTHHMRRRAV